MFMSGVWHGVYCGYYISMGMIPFGLIVEDIWAKILLKDEFYVVIRFLLSYNSSENLSVWYIFSQKK